MPTIETRVEAKRGCGWRQPGGTYMVCDGPGRPCGRIPFELDRCPTCDHGIKPSRSWTWVNAGNILSALPPCMGAGSLACQTCPLNTIFGKVGLMWCGTSHYETPDDFLSEASKMGISKRIPAVPKDFKLGQTWVWLAHRQVFDRPCFDGHEHELGEVELTPEDTPSMRELGDFLADAVPEVDVDDADTDEVTRACIHCGRDEKEWVIPGVFHVFLPSRIEYVVKGDEPDDKLERLEKRGITLVKVERAEEPGDTLKLPLEGVPG